MINNRFNVVYHLLCVCKIKIIQIKKIDMKNKSKKQTEKLDISSNKLLLSGSVSGSASISCLSTNETTTSTTIWKGGWVSDNFSTYYLDENMVKHYR